jgi:hypothetical protein
MSTPTEFEIMKADPGEEVGDFACRMLLRAVGANATVLGEHNQHTLEARPGMGIKEILAPWHEAQRSSYLVQR